MSTLKKAIYALIFCAVFVFVGGAAKQALADATITGKLTKTDGTPIENLRAYAYKGNQMFWDTATDANGDFSIAITGSSITGTYTVKTFDYAIVYDMGTVRYHLEYYFIQENNNVSVTDGATTSGVNFSLTRRGMITGTVTTTSGAPIYNAIIYATAKNGSGFYVIAYTDERGNYYATPTKTFGTSSGAGVYNATISASGYLAKYNTDIQLIDNQSTTLNITLPAQSSISGTVLKPDGTALSGAPVKIYKEGNANASYFATTSSAGAYSVEIGDNLYYSTSSTSAIGNYVVEVSGGETSNYVKQSQRVSITSEESQIANTNFTMANGGIVSGKITKTDGTTAITDATIKVENNDFSQSVTSQGDGTYIIRGIPAGKDYVLTVTRDKYAQSKTFDVKVKAGDTTTKNISLHVKDSSLSGKTRTKKGKAIDNVKVQAVLLTDSTVTKTSYSDSSGNYNLTDLASGEYKVTATKDGYETNELSKLKISGSDTKNFRMKKGAQVSGKIMDKKGNPIIGALVTFSSGRKNNGYSAVYTNEEGNYRIPTLAAAKYSVVASATNFVKKTKTKRFKAGQAFSGYNFKLAKGGTITGYIFNADTKRPLSSRVVQISDSDLYGVTTSSGYYEITGLPKGSYKLFVRDVNYYFEQFYYKASKDTQAKKVKVRSGKETKNINFYLEPYYKTY